MNLSQRVVPITPDQIQWPFNGKPYVSTKPERTYIRQIIVDPFPSYSHDAGLVERTAELVEASFPIGFRPKYYLLPSETPDRVNGFADREFIYDNSSSEKHDWESLVVLLGKRIPLHPAMTRYLVAHEYGHIVQWWIEHERNIKDAGTTVLDEEYMKLRPGTHNEYGGGKWHANVGELIANDFRVCVTGIETEFWPHPGFEHPSKLPEVQDFWKNAVANFAAKELTTETK